MTTTTQSPCIIHVTIELEEQFLRDVLETAINGSINYWANVRESSTDLYELTAVYGPDDNGTDKDDFEPCALSPAIIGFGIKRALERNHCAKQIWSQISNAVHYQDAGYIDADCADVIVQLAVLGEIVYG